MMMPVFSYIYIVVLVLIFFISRSFKEVFLKNVTFLIVLEIINLQGYFVLIAGKEISVVYVQLYITLFLSMIGIYVNNYFIEKKLFYRCLFFIGMPLITIIVEIFIPYDGMVMPGWYEITGSWDLYVQGLVTLDRYVLDISAFFNEYKKILFYSIIVINMKQFLTRYDYIYIFNKLVLVLLVLVAYGYIEFVLKNIINIPAITYEFTELFFGVGKSTFYWEKVSSMSDGLYRLQGFCKEPSHYVYSLMLITVLLFVNTGLNHKEFIRNSLLAIFSIMLMFFTGGMSSIWCVFMLLLSYILIKKYFFKSVSLFLYLCIFVLVFCFLIDSNYMLNSDSSLISRLFIASDTLGYLLDNPNTLMVIGMDLSTLSRFTSIITCFFNWLDRPFIGLGLCSTWALDFTVTMLVKYGLLGVFSWYLFITYKRDNLSKINHLFLITFIFLGGIPLGIVSGFHTYLYYVFLVEFNSLHDTLDKDRS